MNETSNILADVAGRTFARFSPGGSPAHQGTSASPEWEAVVGLGLPLALATEAAGGSALAFGDAFALFRQIGYHGMALPLADTMIAAGALSHAALPIPEGILAIAPSCAEDRFTMTKAAAGWHVHGRAARVGWARAAAAVACSIQHDETSYLAVVPAGHCQVREGSNLAGEPQDAVTVDCIVPFAQVAVLPPGWSMSELAAAARTAQIAGALDRVLEFSVTYAQDRIQFGRPIGKFQAVQQLLAVLAGQVAIGTAAAGLAAEGAARGDRTDIAIAKAGASEAAGVAAAIAHQIHGAMGVTREHPLHHWTLRLLSWRDEFGGEVAWHKEIGAMALAGGGGPNLWAALTR